MKLNKIGFETDTIQDFVKEIETPELKSLIDNYASNIVRTIKSLVVPILLMAHGLKSVKYFQYWIEGSIATKNVGKESTEKGKKEIDEFITSKFKDYDAVKDAIDEIEKLEIKIPIIANTFQNDAINILVNSWIYFEATVRDLWIICVNSYPNLFISNILKSNSQVNDIDGISGKNISIGLLAKYNFNISNSLGDLLVYKYDFTSIAGIYKAYKDLLGNNSNELDFLKTKNLLQLEITRHLLVHCAGKIDQDYLRRTTKTGEILNDNISILPQELGDYCNESILAIKKIFQIIDEKIKNR